MIGTARLVGRHAILPFLGRRLPIVADEHVERDLRDGRGQDHAGPRLLTTTRSRKRHGLPAITVLDEEARINAEGGEFVGRDRYEAREAILDRLPRERRPRGRASARDGRRALRSLRDGRRAAAQSVQWFIRVAPLAERALASVREGRTRILPAPLREGLCPLDGEHPRLGGRPPAVVGPPHPGLVLPGRPHHRDRCRGRA